MHEYHTVDHRNIQRRWDKDKAESDRPEQERVLPKSFCPGLETTAFFKDFCEEGATKVNQLPGEEKEVPGHDRESCRSGREDRFAGFGVSAVAVVAEPLIVEAEEDDDRGAENTD